MRGIKLISVAIKGGASPKVQLKSIIEAGCTENGYDFQEYPVEGSGDINLYYKVTKS